jgi:hypothetical protein
MAHYAKVLEGVVQQVIVAEEEFINSFVDSSPGEWIKCSYNTQGNVHSLGGTPLRKNYPSPSWLYDGTGFYQPKPFDSWTLNSTTYLWEPPVAYPSEGMHTWNEEDQAWDAVE